MIETLRLFAAVLDSIQPDPAVLLVMDLLRIAFYACISIASTWLFFEDYHRGMIRRLLWIGLGTEHGMVLVMLALDLRSFVVWMETRWVLTPFAGIFAIAILTYAYRRYQERRWLAEMFAQQLEESNVTA